MRSSSSMSFNSVQSFMIDVCSGPPIVKDLHNVRLAPAHPYLYLLSQIVYAAMQSIKIIENMLLKSVLWKVGKKKIRTTLFPGFLINIKLQLSQALDI